MISSEDSYSTYEYSKFYKILPQINDWSKDNIRIKDGTKVSEGFIYSSDKNKEWMSKEDMRAWIDRDLNSIGKI